MPTKSTSDRYGSVAISLHWAAAAAVILTFAAGYVVADINPLAPLLLVHIVLGLTVLVLTVLRLLWWWLADQKPELPSADPRWQQIAARVVHVSLYVILLLLPVSGIATLILSGALPTLLAGGPIPDFNGLLPRLTHGLMSKLLLVLFIGHVGAALYHQFVRRDGLMARMGVGRA